MCGNIVGNADSKTLLKIKIPRVATDGGGNSSNKAAKAILKRVCFVDEATYPLAKSQ